MRVLVVEDDPVLAQTLLESLQAHDFEATNARSSQEAWEVLWSRAFDVLVLDVMLPEGADEGFLLAGQIREAGFLQPILFLTARENLTDRVRGLGVGDDYLPKPFALAELVARIKALYRRGEVRPSQVQWHDVRLLPEEKQVRLGDEAVRLTAKEYEVVELFMLNPGRVFARDEILERVWGLEYEAQSNLVDVYIKNLRAKLSGDLIETVRGMGYRHVS